MTNDLESVLAARLGLLAPFVLQDYLTASLRWGSLASVVDDAWTNDLIRSDVYGPARFRPNKGIQHKHALRLTQADSYQVVHSVDEAALSETGFDYVFVCIKALPDVYSLTEVIKPVITASHTCIILHTTNSIGREKELTESFPRNMVLSLCSGVDITQTGAADFDHTAMQPVYLGAVIDNAALPQEAQQDMTESLTLTLEAGGVQCITTANIEKHQWERLIGPMAFHPISIILKEPNLAKLIEEPPILHLISDFIDECLRIAEHRGSAFPFDFKSRTIKQCSTTKEPKSLMYQDFLAGRPLEIEIYLATPIKLAEEASIPVPTIKSIYAMLNHLNLVNQQSPQSVVPPPQGRLAPQHTGQSYMTATRPQMHRGATDGIINGGRAISMVYGHPTANMPPRNPNVQNRRPSAPIPRQDSLEGLEEFADVAMYGDIIAATDGPQYDSRGPGNYQNEMQNGMDVVSGRGRDSRPTIPRAATSQGIYPVQRNQGPPRSTRPGAFAAVGQKMSAMRLSGRSKARDFDDDDDDDGDYIEDAVPTGPPINPDNVDMMAITRRGGRNSAMSFRNDTSNFALNAPRGKSKQSKSKSQAMMGDIPGIHDAVTNTVLFGMGDNRYGTVDSRSLAKTANSRLNSMQSDRLNSISSIQPGYMNGTQYSTRQIGPPNAMNGRGPYSPNGAIYYRPPQQYNGSAQFLRGGLPQQAAMRQHYAVHEAPFPGKSQDSAAQGTRSVTGSASASFGSLGNGSGSHSSSSSRDEMPPLPPK